MHKQRGFTLIELLVVISIIAILAVLVLTNLTGTRIKARNSAAKSDVTEMGKSIELYKADDTNNSAELVIVPGVVAINTDGPVVTLNADTGAAFQSIFAGGTGGNGQAAPYFYSLKIVKTPGKNHTYTYITRTGANVASAIVNDRAGACYVIGTNVDTNTTITDGYLYIKNGTSFNGDTVATPAYPSGPAICN